MLGIAPAWLRILKDSRVASNKLGSKPVETTLPSTRIGWGYTNTPVSDCSCIVTKVGAWTTAKEHEVDETEYCTKEPSGGARAIVNWLVGGLIGKAADKRTDIVTGLGEEISLGTNTETNDWPSGVVTVRDATGGITAEEVPLRNTTRVVDWP